MLKILITDDHAIWRQGFHSVLLKGMGQIEVGEACNATEALQMVRKKKWDAMVMDISMPGRSGLDVLPDIKAVEPKLPVLILSMHDEEQFAMRALKAGASGFLNKASAATELVTAVRKVIAGGRYISPSLAEKLVCHLIDESDKPAHEQLSDREFEIMCMIAGGKSREQIAKALYLSVKTVSTYRARLLEKMKLEGNADITRYAIQKNLIS
jgi:DNA-binding NarL/FixJ family response regulator